MSNKYEVKNALITNPTPRVPVCLILDTSGSMSGDPIEELEEGVHLFLEAIKEDTKAKYSAEISIITFGGTVKVHNDFRLVDQISAPHFSANGNTPMEEAVRKGVELLEKAKNNYKNHGVAYYQPWMIIISDGEPSSSIDNIARVTYKMTEDRKLVCFPLAVYDADMDELGKFSNKGALKLNGINFKEFFEWLSKSVQTVSHSSVSDSKVELPQPGPSVFTINN